MDKEYYREYFTFEREHWWFRARSRILAAQVAKLVRGVPGRARILNIGAALGASTDMLGRYGDVVSVEYEKACCDFVALSSGKIFINASITDLPFPTASFDLVCAFDVIEHVEDDARAVSEMMRVCRPGGAVAVTVPAFMMLWSHHDSVNHHQRRYRLPELTRLFQSSGRVLFASYFNSVLFVPIVGVRAMTKLVPQHWIRTGSGSDFSLVKSRVLDRFFYGVLNLEDTWLRRGWTFPFGVSIFLSWRKGPDVGPCQVAAWGQSDPR
jgi:SAM-dependent methyltransferase